MSHTDGRSVSLCHPLRLALVQAGVDEVARDVVTDFDWDDEKDARTALLWRDVVSEKMDAPLLEEDLDMVDFLTWQTLRRWQQLVEGEDDPALAFRELYAKNKTLAQGAIIAVVEVMKAISEAKPLPGHFKEMMI